MVENDMPDNQNHNANRGHGDTHDPRPIKVNRLSAEGIDSPGDQQRDAANNGQGGEGDDKRRNAFIGNKKAVDGAN
jgi:hypothetical protein